MAADTTEPSDQAGVGGGLFSRSGTCDATVTALRLKVQVQWEARGARRERQGQRACLGCTPAHLAQCTAQGATIPAIPFGNARAAIKAPVAAAGAGAPVRRCARRTARAADWLDRGRIRHSTAGHAAAAASRAQARRDVAHLLRQRRSQRHHAAGGRAAPAHRRAARRHGGGGHCSKCSFTHPGLAGSYHELRVRAARTSFDGCSLGSSSGAWRRESAAGHQPLALAGRSLVGSRQQSRASCVRWSAGF